MGKGDYRRISYTIRSVAEYLAEGLINAAKRGSNSYAIKKKDELEQAVGVE